MMNILSFNAYQNATSPKKKVQKETAKGYLLNTYIKNQQPQGIFDKTSVELLIPDNSIIYKKKSEKKEAFDEKSAIKPIIMAAGFSLGALSIASLCVGAYSKVMAKSDGLIRPPDLARNVNIVEEPHFAMYRALRDPNARNIIGLIGVGLMSAATLCAKNLTDGIKEVWIKKQECDIEYDAEEKLINIEASAFSGKLNAVNKMLIETSDYFKKVLTNNDNNKNPFVNFKGAPQKENVQENTQESAGEDREDKKKNQKKLLPYALLGVGAFCSITFLLFKNYQKIVKNLDTFVNKTTDAEIKNKINNAINSDNKEKAIKELSDVLKITSAKEDKMRENFNKIKNITPDEVKKAILDIQKERTYVEAPEALGGVGEKIQYYCYINENRGHLYNWILNPENKFNKYIFLTFCMISSIGYLGKTCADAIKDVTVKKENKKSEVNLRKRLVDVEIENFKAKKMSAITPLMDDFKLKLQQGKNTEELCALAQNILMEIKNGPPYIYS